MPDLRLLDVDVRELALRSATACPIVIRPIFWPVLAAACVTVQLPFASLAKKINRNLPMRTSSPFCSSASSTRSPLT